MEEALSSSSIHPLPSQLKKRKRLNAVLDKISHRSESAGNNLNNNRRSRMADQEPPPAASQRRRELWRDNPQRNVHEEVPEERKRLPKRLVIDSSGGSESLEDSDVASPPHKPSSPQVSSPRICFSPLRIKDSIEEEEDIEEGSSPLLFNVPKFNLEQPRRSKGRKSSRNTAASSKYIRSVSPNLREEPHPRGTLDNLPSYLTEIYRRRCLSDTDLSATLEDLLKAQSGQKLLTSLKQQQQGGSQDSPLDLSLKSNVSSTTGTLLTPKELSSSSLESLPKSTTANRAPCLPRSLRSSLEIVETSGNPEVSYSCPICGQMFSLHDRLAKHMASRHKSSREGGGPSNAKAYACEVCKRSFARSDMLTRHMRLHTGIKPYTCRICGQVFSRSDHLSTHQRTHTGEKPYRCPSCPYAACRRDMITRHMRTHTRYELNESTSVEDNSSSSRSISCESDWNPESSSKEETISPSTTTTSTTKNYSSKDKPPSPMDTTTPNATTNHNKKPATIRNSSKNSTSVKDKR